MTKAAVLLAGALALVGCGLDKMRLPETAAPVAFPDVAGLYEFTPGGVVCRETMEPSVVTEQSTICYWQNVSYLGQPECFLSLTFERLNDGWTVTGSAEVRGPVCP